MSADRNLTGSLMKNPRYLKREIGGFRFNHLLVRGWFRLVPTPAARTAIFCFNHLSVRGWFRLVMNMTIVIVAEIVSITSRCGGGLDCISASPHGYAAYRDFDFSKNPKYSKSATLYTIILALFLIFVKQKFV